MNNRRINIWLCKAFVLVLILNIFGIRQSHALYSPVYDYPLTITEIEPLGDGWYAGSLEVAAKSITDRWPNNIEEYAQRVINMEPVAYEDIRYDWLNVHWSTKHNAGTYDATTGEITLQDVYTTYNLQTFSEGMISKHEHKDVVATVSPLTPILIVPKTGKLPLIETALGGDALPGQMYVVPAIFLKYNHDKIRNDYIEKGIVTTLDVATIALSGGTALATKVHWVRRAWALAEVVGAVGNIAVNTQAISSPRVKEAVDIYNAAMGLIGLNNIGQGGYKFIKNLPEQTKKLLQKNERLKDQFVANYLNYRIAITKLKNSDDWAELSEEVRQRIIKQEKNFIDFADAKNIPNDKWGAPDDIFINGKTKQDILSIRKGERPAPETYLDARYIKEHLEAFEKEGIVSRIVTKENYERYGIGKPDVGKTEFVGRKSEIDDILKLPLSEISQKLGIPIEQLQGGNILRIDFKLNKKYRVTMPTGNEFGTNNLWIPGGKLPEGNSEAIIKTEGMIKDIDYSVKEILL